MTWAYKESTCPACESHAIVVVGEWQIMDKAANKVCLCKECNTNFYQPYILVFDKDKWHESLD